MSDELEIDLRPYIQVLFKYWYLVILIPLVAAIATYLFLSFQPPFYEATAMVAITDADFLVNLDERIQTLDEGRPAYKALPDFAISSEIVNLVYEALDPKPEKIDSAERLGAKLQAESAEDIRLVILTVTMPSPEEAALVANMWAEQFIKKAHEVYGDSSSREISYYETQITHNTIELDAAEKAINEFQFRNELAPLRNELAVTKDFHKTYLNQQRRFELVIRDLAGLRTNLQTRNPTEPATLADQLSFISLQTAAYNAGDSIPVFLQLPESFVLTEETVREQLIALDDLIAFLQDKTVELGYQIDELLPILSKLQQDINLLEIEQNHLNKTLVLKREIDTMLARKYEEVSLTSQQTPNEFRSASKAFPPEEPAGPKKLISTVASGAVSGLLTVSVILFIYYWRTSAPEGEDPQSKTPSTTSKIRRLFGGDGRNDLVTSQEKQPESTEE